MIDIEKLADEYAYMKGSDCDYAFSFDYLKQFAEAYHKAMCEQSEPVAWMNINYDAGFKEIKVWQEPISNKSIPLYTTPQPLKRLSEDEILKLLNVKNDSPNVLVYLGISNAIMDEMERINK